MPDKVMKDYYYKYKALKYYLKNKSIGNNKMKRGGNAADASDVSDASIEKRVENLEDRLNLLSANLNPVLHDIQDRITVLEKGDFSSDE